MIFIHLFEDIGWLTKMENLMLNLLKVMTLLSVVCMRSLVHVILSNGTNILISFTK